MFANVLFLVLDPACVSRTAVGLELDSTDVPTLHFTTLLWRYRPESRPAIPLTECMGRHYQQRSPSTCYANMARQCQGRKSDMVGCHVKSWCVPSNIFKI